MVDRSPILPFVNDSHGASTFIQEPGQGIDDDTNPGRQSYTVLGGVPEAAGEIASQSPDCTIVPAAAPVGFISNLRYKRRECLDYDKILSYDRIGPRNSAVQTRQLPSDCKWVPHIHPEGSVYFQQENWFTNVWLYDPQNLRDVDAALQLVVQELRQHRIPLGRYEICVDIDTEVDDYTREIVKLACYYMWDKDAEEVFWLQETMASFFYDGVDVKILGREHLRNTWLLTFNCRDHIYMFPHGRSLDIEQLQVLRADITYYMFDKKTSKSSTVPYNKDDLTDLLGILKETGASMKDDQDFHLQGTVAITRPQHVVIVSRLKKALYRERFERCHGERYVQLDSDRSVYRKKHRERSLWFTILTCMFFFIPPVYFEQIMRIWLDQKVNHEGWRDFIRNLQDDWMASITPSAVILGANVGFLAIQSVDMNGNPVADRSMGQIVSYMSILYSIGNILACTILSWQYRHRFSEDAVKYLATRASSSTMGIEKLAIIFSIPMTLFLLALLTFFIAISWLCVHTTDSSTRFMTVITMFTNASFVLQIICHNREWKSERDAGSLARGMAQMKKLVTQARSRSVNHWTAFSSTWPIGIYRKRKSEKPSRSPPAVPATAW